MQWIDLDSESLRPSYGLITACVTSWYLGGERQSGIYNQALTLTEQGVQRTELVALFSSDSIRALLVQDVC